MDTVVQHTVRTVLGAAAVVSLTVGLAACGAPSTDPGTASPATGGSAGLPETIQLVSIRELTGPLTYAGEGAQRGIDLAIEEIEAAGLLGDSRIEVEVRDTGGNPQEAASAASQAIADPDVAAVFGPGLSSGSVAVAPIAQQAGMPTVFVQSGSDGVLLGDATFRVTAPAESYFDLIGPHLEDAGTATAAVLYNSGVPTLVELGTAVVPELGEAHGFEVVDTSGVDTAAQDFTSAASGIAAADPDVAFVLLTGPQNPVAVTQLRQAGFDGEIVGMLSMGAGNLAPAGATAAGVLWPTDFTPSQPGPEARAFVEAYEAEHGEPPDNFAAEGYDAMWFLARGLAAADSTDRTALRAALADVAEEGFTGAEGQLSFEGNDLRVPGVLVRWDGEREVLAGAGS